MSEDIFHDFDDPDTKRPWRVRLVRQGDRYGLNRCLTHDEVEPMVEFYDREFAGGRSSWGHSFPDEGEFVHWYRLSSLLKRGGGMLNLDDGVEVWRISAEGMRVVMRHVVAWQAWTIVHT